ncbi:MAG: DUF423 domain-containing protein [Flavobacteriaceae bacterium]|nr:DUF423 domain-containing protein [Flavobacteriaceae bacterium]
MKKLDKKIVIIASVLGAVTIAIGAFGAHGLKELVDVGAISSFETGVRYQMYHVIVLLIIGFAPPLSVSAKKWVLRFFCVGMLLFSGSIYLLALKEVLPFSVKFLGPVTPLGGLLLILGWLRLGYGLFKLKSKQF